MSSTSITTQTEEQIIASVEAIEAYAGLLDSLDTTARTRLLRIIRALARIADRKQSFAAVSVRKQDEDGHWDNSYPPKIVNCDHSGPRLIKIVSCASEDISTSDGFYYDWRRVSTDLGLWIAPNGTPYGCAETGTGRFGQFAAHPGNCDVSIDLEREPLDTDEIPLDRLQKAVRELVAIAFPAAKDSAAAKALIA